MTALTKQLQDNLIQIMTKMDNLQYLGKNAYDRYWDTDANTKVSGASAGVQVLVDPQVKKEDYLNGITLSDNLYKFFNNTAVATTDHLQFCNLIRTGTDYATPITSELSPATGEVGGMITEVANTCLDLLDACRANESLYFDNEIGDLVSVLDGERIVYGSSVTRNDLSSAITLLQQFQNFMTAATITTGDYSVTLSKWKAY